MRRVVVLAVAATALFAVSCATTPSSPTPVSNPATPQPSNSAFTQPFFGPHGFDLSAMDTTANACDDFYRFAVGKWREMHPLPSTYSRYGRFEELAERNRETLHKILEEDAANTSAPAGSAARKLGDYYSACMNESGIESAGLSPIKPELDRIDAIADAKSLQDEFVRLQRRGIAPGFRFASQNDFMNSKMMIAALGAGGLGLPDRDYYLRDDARFTNIRKQYVDHVAKMLALAGEDPARAAEDAGKILAFETRLSKAQLTRVEQRDPHNTYHITKTAELQTEAPAIDWSRFFAGVGAADLQSLNVSQPKYVAELNTMLTEVPLDDWKAFLRWKVIEAAAPTLSSAYVSEEFAFSRVLSGQQTIQPRWQRCVRATDASLGNLLGQEYVRRTFTPEAKRKMNELIDNLISALRADIPTLAWMGPETKQAALEKLNAMGRRIGYPDKWIDYATLDVSHDSYAANVAAARAFAFKRAVNRIGKAEDPAEWGFFTPPTVNANYTPSRNDITFPAGILQPPFYDPKADDAYNYGGIGTVIGHEMTHGFDDEGARFDAQGNLRNWFTPEDLKNFQARTKCVSNEYSEFNVAPGINIKGDLVTGEEVADLGGATIALAAYEKSLEGKERKTIDGFSPEQRFFLGFAQVWAENMAPEEQTRRALTDPHAQGPFRVNGTVQNMPAFKAAFHCNEGSKMVREEGKRCSIW
jgi:putative endopeptidase